MSLSIKRICFLCLLLIWMGTVFMFSHQDATKSSDTSNVIVERVAQIFQVTDSEGVENISFIIRKLAHFSLYAVGGILAFLFFHTLEIDFWKTFVMSQGLGVFYAMTDEFHQFFVPGRSAELRDVCIDSMRCFGGNSYHWCTITLLEKWRKE